MHVIYICVGRDWRQAGKRTWRFMDMLDFYIASRSSQAQLLQRSYTTCVVGLLHGYMRQRFVFDVLKRWEKWAGWKGPRGEGVVFGFAPWQWVFHLWSCQHAFCAKLFATSFKCRRFCSLPVLLPCSRWLFPTTSCKIIFGDKLVSDPGHTYPTLSYYIWFREPSSIPPFCDESRPKSQGGQLIQPSTGQTLSEGDQWLVPLTSHENEKWKN